VGKAIKKTRNKKTAGDGDIPREVLKMLGKHVLRLTKQLINNIHETGEWPKDFTAVAMIALKKKPQAAKCSEHHTISLIARTAQIVARIIRKRTERKTEDVLGEDQLGFRRGKGTKDANGMLRISERTLLCKLDQINADPKGNW
jgi:hypothetical protein